LTDTPVHSYYTHCIDHYNSSKCKNSLKHGSKFKRETGASLNDQKLHHMANYKFKNS
ncbi:hypothetical protein T06_639, partial [Trichinella sp. T6]